MKPWLLLAAVALTAQRVSAYDAQSYWPSGTRTYILGLSTVSGAPSLPSGGLADGTASWDAIATAAINAWKPYMARTVISTTTSSSKAAEGNGKNEIQFSADIYGEAFGDRVLAVTATLYDSAALIAVRHAETDILVNTKYSWDSYRGTLRTAVDLRRVLIHEFGHAIGLNHPDQADPVQSVSAIMNSTISSAVDALTSDDIAGAKVLYDSAPATPVITQQPTSQSVAAGQNATFSVQINNSTPAGHTPTLSYVWQFRPTGGSFENLFTYKDATLLLGAAQTYDAGSYRLTVVTPDAQATSSTATLSVSATSNNSATKLANLSSRAIAGSGNRALIVGFSLTGTQARRILLRGIGPGLAAFGVADTLPDPVLELTTASGSSLGSNDSWGTQSSVNLKEVFTSSGAFALPDGSKDAAMVVTLSPGNYTALLTPKTGTAEGLALVEAYDLDAATAIDSRLSNLSTRGYVSTDSNIIIAGFQVNGTGPKTFLIRGIGDTLTSFGVTSTLDDPILSLFDSAGQLLRVTDDWDSPAFLQTRLRSVFSQVGAFLPTDRQESCFWLTLPPGNYTAHFAGLNGGTGVGLIEIYEAPAP